MTVTATAAAEEAAAGPGPRASVCAPWMRIGRSGGGGGGGGVGGPAPGRWGAEDEAAAWRSRRGGGRRAVAAVAATGPGGRARTHGEVPRPVRPPRASSPVAHRGRPHAAWKARRSGESPQRPGDSFRLGLAEQEPWERGAGISVRSWDRAPFPSARASFTRPAPQWRRTPASRGSWGREGAWEGLGFSRRGSGATGRLGSGLLPPREGDCLLATEGCDAEEDGCIAITQQPLTRKYPTLHGPLWLFSPASSQTGLKPWGGASLINLN